MGTGIKHADKSRWVDRYVSEYTFREKETNELQNQPPELRKEIFRRLLEACEIAAFDAEKRIKYDKDMYDERRRQGELNAAKADGRQEGLEQGLRQGLEQGRREASLKSAKNLKALGVAVEIIAQGTGLSIEEIESL
jgi:predicted transposase/invertase (TIGR01784 family)